MQADVVQLLGMEGWLVFEFNKSGAGVYRLPKAHPGEKQRWRSVRGGTVPKGWFDVLAIRYAITWGEFKQPDGKWHPVYLHVECKAPGKHLDPDQVKMKGQLEAQGALCVEVHSAEEMAKYLRGALGMELRTGMRE